MIEAEIETRSKMGDETSQEIVVLIPVFQAQKDLDETLESLKHSTVSCDVLVVDDGSKEPITIRDYGRQLRILLVRLEKNSGIVVALNEGLEIAINRGYTFIARIDAGDLMAADRLFKQKTYLDDNVACMLVGCDAEIRDENGSFCFTFAAPREPKRLASALHERPWLLHPSVMYRSKVFSDVGRYSQTFDAAEDYELFLRIADRHEVGTVPETLLTYIVRNNGISKRKERLQTISRLRIQVRYFKWTELMSYHGVFRTAVLLLLPLWLKSALKRRYLYAWGKSNDTV